MHERFSRSGMRAHEMMKGTAAIHLHASILDIEELARLYDIFCHLSCSDELGIHGERKDIWRHTDPCRCGLPRVGRTPLISQAKPEDVLSRIVRHALEAVDLETTRPFHLGEKSQDERAFLDHLTTIFTNVRLNLKGGTLELRTLDSMPRERFVQKWNLFLAAIPPHPLLPETTP
jgi:glutamate--cysteine ligase